MMIFWIVVALLIIAALLFVIPPLISRKSDGGVVERGSLNISIYRDQLAELERDLKNDVITQEQYEQGRIELERRLLEDVPENVTPGANEQTLPAQHPYKRSKVSAIVVAIALPVFAISIYQWLGTPASISPEGHVEASTEAAMDNTSSPMSEQVKAMVKQLAQRLKDDPSDPEGWSMLGRSYLVLGRPDEAVKAYENAVALAKDDPNLLVDYADALAMASGEQSLEGQPLELIQQALALDPNNQKGLWLAGTAEYEKADFQQALKYWRKLYPMLPKNSEDARVMQGNIKEAESLLASRSKVATADGPEQDLVPDINEDQNGGHITGIVRLDKRFEKQVDDNDTVFIFARAAEGPRMPLAVMRAQVKDLPLDFSLDDSMAINSAMTISQYPEVIVVARVSKSGNATPQSGDVQGTTKVLHVGVDEAEVIMNEVIP